MIKPLLQLLLMLFVMQLAAQNAAAPTDIPIADFDSLADDVYLALQDNRLIMVGELHGTNEPVQFAKGLAELFQRHGDTVQIGFEIPEEAVIPFLKAPTADNLYNSPFFKDTSVDGRASVAWASAILSLSKSPKADIFFFDVNSSDTNDFEARDSFMYAKIKTRLINHPNWKTIVLSGNVHNMLLPHKGKSRAGYYLTHDQQLNLSGQICSLNIDYNGGTMFNNDGSGLQLKNIGPGNEKGPKVRYLKFFPKQMNLPYTGLYFTPAVTAAMPAFMLNK